MRITRILPVILAASLVACAEDPADPSSSLSLAGPAEAAVVERGEAVFTFSATHYFDCVGEEVQNEVYAPYRWFRTQTPDGDYIYHEHWDPQLATGTFIGVESGTIWTRVNNGGPQITSTMGGGLVQGVFHGFFMSETGIDLRVHQTYHMSRNAAGELVVEKFSFTCEPM